MNKSKMQDSGRNVSFKGRPIASIMEGEELHTFVQQDEEDDQEEEYVKEPSPRLRSRSWAEGSIVRPTSGASPGPGCAGADAADSARYESLPHMYWRSERRLGTLNSQLLAASQRADATQLQRLLEAGASPDATCRASGVCALHLAAAHDAAGALVCALLAAGARRTRTDARGRTPLHFAACAGNLRPLLTLLGLPRELLKDVENGELTVETEEAIAGMSEILNMAEHVEARCHLGDIDVGVPKPWRDNIDHACGEIDVPFLAPGWTALHAAAARAQAACCRALLAAGAPPCERDVLSRTPLDVAGVLCRPPTGTAAHPQTLSAEIVQMKTGFTEVVSILLSQHCPRRTSKSRVRLDSPLHMAVELDCSEAALMLLRSGASPTDMNRSGLTPLHLCVDKRLHRLLQTFLYFDTNEKELKSGERANVVNKDGYTVLHYAVASGWHGGVCVCLETGANVIHPANNRETSLHTAAGSGNLQILKEILRFTKSTNLQDISSTSNLIDVLNGKGETALFKAISNGHIECVKTLLEEGASIIIELPRQYNVFHVAARLGHTEILRVLLDYNYAFTREKVNSITIDDRRGFGPLHFAVEYNHIECVKLMLAKNAYISLKTGSTIHRECTPLHIAARKNHLEIAKIIVKFDATTVTKVDEMGWTPLHTASYYASRDVITFLIQENSDLSVRTTGPQNYQKTVVEMIVENLSKPTEFLETIFDKSIHRPNKMVQSMNGEPSYQDLDTEVVVDYSVLLPKTDNPVVKLAVIESILKTGNRSGQRKLLIHPLIESYLCLRWKALLPFFYAMLIIYGVFVLILTLFVMSEFGYRDSDPKIEKPAFWDSQFWIYFLYITIALVLTQEIIFMSANLKHYFKHKETWVKLASVILGMSLPFLIVGEPSLPPGAVDWGRHVATVAVVLCWMDMTFLLSRFPNWGYYVLMFGKVCVNVIKILLTFAFLVVGFALSFMIQFYHKTSFESFWTALVKTMVMMTSEFDYDDLVDKTDSTKPQIHSLGMIRFVFLVFLVLGAIVLMNLMVGVAVHDLHNLEVLGHIMRIEKQVEFLASLETLVLKRIFTALLPSKWIYNLRFSSSLTKIYLKPCEPRWSYYKAIPAHVRDAIFEKAVAKKKTEDYQVNFESLKKQISEIHEAVAKFRSKEQSVKRYSSDQPKNIQYRLNDTDVIVVRMKKQIEDLTAKVNVMMDMMIAKAQQQ